MKGQDAAVLTSLIRMKQEGVVPARDVIAAFTPDEETRGDYGAGWLVKEHSDLIDAALVINPDGGEAAVKSQRRIYLALQTSEKIFATFQLETTDKGGHSSRPTAENPIYRLASGLERLAALKFPVHLTDTTKLYFARRAEIESGALQRDMRAVVRQPPDPAAIETLSTDVETNIQLRTTCTTTMIEGGHAENALPQRARATVQCRIIPGESPQSVVDTIRRTLNDPRIEITVITPAIVAADSAPTPEMLEITQRVARSVWPGVMVLPEMSPGATDSVYTRALGIPSYGIDGMFDDLDDGRAHGRDERIGVAAFAEEIEFTYRLMRAVADGK
jgi:acetylornithine deacetylase/succinyl-diaminopimelate desuccinylase-like protein